MTGNDLYGIFTNVTIRNCFLDLSCAFSRNIEIQKTLLAQAWIAVSEMPRDYTEEAYIGRGYEVMRHKYEIYYAPVGGGRPSHMPANRRAKKILKSYVNYGL